MFGFQSTPPRGGRPPDRERSALLDRVSIHAPARGATFRARRPRHCQVCFNPRPRAGGDLVTVPADSFEISVSIHAPARGATWWGFQRDTPSQVSIHAPARGATAHGRHGRLVEGVS